MARIPLPVATVALNATVPPAGLQGVEYLMRQGRSLGGGSNEMQRNIISERVLGMPREYATDKDKPFDEVRHNAPPSRYSEASATPGGTVVGGA